MAESCHSDGAGDAPRFLRRPRRLAPLPPARSLEFNGTTTHVALPMLRADFSMGFALGSLGLFRRHPGRSAGHRTGPGELADNITLCRSGSSAALSLQVVRGPTPRP